MKKQLFWGFSLLLLSFFFSHNIQALSHDDAQEAITESFTYPPKSYNFSADYTQKNDDDIYLSTPDTNQIQKSIHQILKKNKKIEIIVPHIIDLFDELNYENQTQHLFDFLAEELKDDPMGRISIAYINALYGYNGSIVDTVFYPQGKAPYFRGSTHGKRVNIFERKRVIAINKLLSLLPESYNDLDSLLIAQKSNDIEGIKHLKSAQTLYIYRCIAFLLCNPNQRNTIPCLLTLTDLTTIPKMKTGLYRNPTFKGIPLGDDGNIIIFNDVKKWEDAKNDGERFLFCINQMKKINSEYASNIWNNFLEKNYCAPLSGKDQDCIKLAESLYDSQICVNVLLNNKAEQRIIVLPEQYNIIAQLKSIPDSAKSSPILMNLYYIYKGRKNYLEAEKLALTALNLSNDNELIGRANNHDFFGHTYNSEYRELCKLNKYTHSIIETPNLDSQGRLSFKIRYRNAPKIQYTIYKVDLDSLFHQYIDSIKKTSNSKEYYHLSTSRIASDYIDQHDIKKLPIVAQWETKTHAKKHYTLEDIVKPDISLKNGTYIIESTNEQGAQSLQSFSASDLTIAMQSRDENDMNLFIHDKMTGDPIKDAKIYLFIYERTYSSLEQMYDSSANPEIITKEFNLTTDQNGCAHLSDINRFSKMLGYVKTIDGRMLYINQPYFYGSFYHPSSEHPPKMFLVTNQPVYRPGQTVKIGGFLRHANYTNEKYLKFPTTATMKIQDPKGTVIQSSQLTSSPTGIFEYEFVLPKEPILGNYSIRIINDGEPGYQNFLVEEYRKPEFKVTILPPDTPLKFGDLAEIKIRGDYYIGLPVASGKLRLKIEKEPDNKIPVPWSSWSFMFEDRYKFTPLAYRYSPPEVVVDSELTLNDKGELIFKLQTAKKDFSQLERYNINVSLSDQSLREEKQTSSFVVTDRPLNITTVFDAEYYTINQPIHVDFNALSIRGTPLETQGVATLYQLKKLDKKEIENPLLKWVISTDSTGKQKLSFSIPQEGYYTLKYVVNYNNATDTYAYSFHVINPKKFSTQTSISPLKISTDKKEYGATDTVKLLIESSHKNGYVALFFNTTSKKNPPFQMIKLDGFFKIVEFQLSPDYQPNLFIQAYTIFNDQQHSINKEMIIPPGDKTLNIKLDLEKNTFAPNEEVKVKLATFSEGKKVSADCIVAIYDESLDAIANGSNIPDIVSFYWGFKNYFNALLQRISIEKFYASLAKESEKYPDLSYYGFDYEFQDNIESFFCLKDPTRLHTYYSRGSCRAIGGGSYGSCRAPRFKSYALADKREILESNENSMGIDEGMSKDQAAQIHLRSHFSDAPYWSTQIKTDSNGEALFKFNVPENLGRFIIKVWAASDDVKVGSLDTTITVNKELMLSVNPPRFMIEGDSIDVRALFHHKNKKNSACVYNTAFKPFTSCTKSQNFSVTQDRIEFNLFAQCKGTEKFGLYLSCNCDSDAMLVSFPILERGIIKQIASSQTLNTTDSSISLELNIPDSYKKESAFIKIQCSPSVITALVDALPYVIGYPYGCTEQTLNRFIPCAILQEGLKSLNISLDSVALQRAQTRKLSSPAIIGYDEKNNPIYSDNPIYSTQLVADMIQVGINRLTNLQNSDGSWSWFAGFPTRSPYMTNLVVEGLQNLDHPKAKSILESGVNYLVQTEAQTLKCLNLPDTHPEKIFHLSNLDARIYAILSKTGKQNKGLDSHVWEHRHAYSIDVLATLALGYIAQNDLKRALELKGNIEQYLEFNLKTQTAYLRLNNSNYFWFWYGDDIETHARYLDLLVATEPTSPKTASIVKFLLENRKQGAWHSTRATGLCIHALLNYVKKNMPNHNATQIDIFFNQKLVKSIQITRENEFISDCTVLIDSQYITSGKQIIHVRRSGDASPVYCHAYAQFFSKEDPITAAGLEINVNRRHFKIVESKQYTITHDANGKPKSVEHIVYERRELSDKSTIHTGDIIEVELIISTDNDYQYIHVKDPKSATFETLESTSGVRYNGSLYTYQEFYDASTNFFIENLPQGTHVLTYRVRAEKSGTTSALPTQIELMYTPSIRSNSEERKIKVSPKIEDI